MKSKLRNLLLAAMALTLFAGCSNIALNDASYEGSDAGDKCVLTIGIDGFTGAGSAIGRYIAPDKYTVKTGTDATKFVIEGKSARNGTLAPTLLTFTGTSSTITLDYDVWYLTLHAVEGDVPADTDTKKVTLTSEGKIPGNEILRGITSVDLKKTKDISFILSSKDVTTDGSLALTVKGLNSSVKSYYAGLYDINTDVLKYELADSDLATLADISLSKDSIAPGSYIFKFIPYNNVKSNTDREDLTPWSDLITIAPGRETSKEITVTIMTAPAKPTNFTAVLVDNSEDDKDDTYTVRLNWIDNSTNEENFVLRIYESNGTETNDELFVDSKKIVTFDKNFFADNKYWVSGTLGMSTQECEIKLTTGHLYEMTLTAKNRAGESIACTRIASNSNATNGLTGFAITKSTTTTDEEGNEVPTTVPVRVNRQKITYNLMGGTYTADATVASPVYSTEDIVDFKTYEGTAPSIEKIKAPASLIYNDHSWSKWVNLPEGSSEITVAPDYQDVMVYASYNLDATVGYDIADEYKTLVVSAACTTEGATYTAATETEPATLVLNVTNNPTVKGGNIIFTIRDTDKDGNALPHCDKIYVIVDSDSAKIKANSTSYPYPLAKFKNSGVYNITVIGEYDGQLYSCAPIALTVDIK